MVVKTITITEEAYEKVKGLKKEDESFSQLFIRIVNGQKINIRDFLGVMKLSEKEAKEWKEELQEKFTVRELAKRTKIPPSSLQRYLMKLRKLQVINKENTLVLSSYVRYVKMSFFVEQMYISGLVQYLEQELQASTIILFGSIRKGEYDAESDVDIFVASVKKIKLDLSVYEKALGHPIQLFIEENIYKLPERLRNNVLNGIKLQGYFSL